MCNGFKSKNFMLVEVVAQVTTAGNQNFFFQQQPQLQSYKSGGQKVYIDAIEIMSNKALSTSPLTSGTAVATAAALQNAVLTINEAGTLNKLMLPLVLLNRVQAEDGANFVPGVQQLFQFADLWEVDWSKSYITLVAAQGTAYSYLFGVHYHYGH
jgi:hypothetical protein